MLRSTSSSPSPAKKHCWWGRFDVPLGSSTLWEIGPLTLVIRRNPEDWMVARSRQQNPYLDRCSARVPAPPGAPTEEVVRFGAAGSSGSISVLPVHADRPVVITPEEPFTLPPRRSIRLFVSLPLWVELIEGDGSRLLDEPILRPSDTWHGPNTMSGELCYAGRAHAQVALDTVSVLPHRIIAPLVVNNNSGTELHVEKVKLPTPHLSVLEDPAGGLWSETVVFERANGSAQSEVRIDPTPPRGAGELARVRGPRAATERKFLWQAFSELFT